MTTSNQSAAATISSAAENTADRLREAKDAAEAGLSEAMRRGTEAVEEARDAWSDLDAALRETVRELGEYRATGFLKKFYGWYLGRGRFPKPFKQELVTLPTIADVETRLLAAAPGARFVLERLQAEVPEVDEVLLDSLPISVYGGG